MLKCGLEFQKLHSKAIGREEKKIISLKKKKKSAAIIEL